MQDRIKSLQGVRNFRDFGGYETPEGRVKSGLLFRSGHYHEASEDDSAALNGLNVTFHADLRRPDERDRQPNKWPLSEIEQIVSSGGREEIPAHIAALQGENVTPQSIEAYMVNYYRSAPYKAHHIELFTAWFEGIARADGAVIVHCAAGKDRTGIICALTHIVLGVGEEDMFADYLLTNAAVDLEKRLPEARDKFNAFLGKSYDSDIYRPFMGVRRAYLENTFEVIQESHGSAQGYIRDELGVDEDKVAHIKSRFLEA